MKFAITGPLADKNLGDYGMFINNLYELGSEHEYTVFSYSSEFVNDLNSDFLSDYKIDFIDVELNPKEVEELSFKGKLRKIKRQIMGQEQATYPTPLQVVNRCNNYDQIKQAVANSDVLIVSGGGYFNDLWYTWRRSDDLIKIIIPIIFAAFMKKKIVFTANGYGPFDVSKQFYSMLFAEAKNAYIGCRDEKLSPLYLSDLNVKKIEFLPDDLYLIHERLLSSNISERFGKYVVLEIYGSMKDLQSNIDKLNALVEHFADSGCKTVFMPFDIDIETKAYLKENILSSSFEFFDFDNYLRLDDAISMIENAELVICNRYHALVISVTSKTPVINIIKPIGDYRYYYNKNAGLLDNAFGSENIDYNDFIAESIADVYEKVHSGFDCLINKQLGLFESKAYLYNKERLKAMRSNYFNTVIKGEGAQ